MNTLGVDAHKRVHVAVALDAEGRFIAHWRGENSPAGWEELRQWSSSQHGPCHWGVVVIPTWSLPLGSGRHPSMVPAIGESKALGAMAGGWPSTSSAPAKPCTKSIRGGPQPVATVPAGRARTISSTPRPWPGWSTRKPPGCPASRRTRSPRSLIWSRVGGRPPAPRPGGSGINCMPSCSKSIRNTKSTCPHLHRGRACG
jgi:hypothetical protein